MALDKTLDALNEKLAKTFGFVKDIEKAVKGIEKSAGKVNLGGGKAGSVNNQAGSKGNLLANSLGGFSTPPPGKGGGTVAAGGAAGGGGGGLSGRAAAYTGGSGAMANQMLADARRQERVGQIMSGSLAVFTGATAAAWTGTPGALDAVTYKASVFMPKFTLPDGFANKDVDKRIIKSMRGMASSTFGAQAAASMAVANGVTFNMAGGKVLDNMLSTAGLMYGMSGMSNEASMRGQLAMSKGTAGVSDRLSKIGIFTVNMQTGKPKDMGEIVDSLWARLYGSKTAKVSEEEFGASLYMGWLGAELNALFGDQPELYEQVVNLMWLKVRSGGKSIKAGSKKAKKTAEGLGMTDYNTPTPDLGRVSTARSKTVEATSDDLMNGFVNSSYILEDFNSAVVKVTDNLGPLAGFFLNFKSLMEGLGPTEVGGTVSALFGLLKNLIPGLGFAPGGSPEAKGYISGPGTSTSDSVPVRLSKGEFVINASAAKLIGKQGLHELNALGQSFGSAYASPVALLNHGGEPSGQDIVNFATKFVGTPYVDSAKLKGGQGSASPENGWDCSTFTHWVFKNFGINLPMYSDAYLNVGTMVDDGDLELDKLAPGDLLLWHTNDDKITGHVSIYAGNGQHVHAANRDKDTVLEKIDSWYKARFYQARRVSSDLLKPPTGETLGRSDADSPVSEPRRGSGLYKTGTSGLWSVAVAGTELGIMSDGKTFSPVMGTSLAGFGKTGKSVGSFTSGYVSASSVGNNAQTLSVLTGNSGTSNGGTTTSSSTTSVSGSQSVSDLADESGRAGKKPKGRLSDWLTAAGFRGIHHREAWAIAMRESGGNPTQHNTTPPDDSYGLFQINYYKPAEAAERDRKFRQYVAGYHNRKDLLDPLVNARAAAYMSQKGRNWSSWVSPQYGAASKYYKEYETKARSSSIGERRVSNDGVYNLHQNEMVFPAMESEMFRQQLREFLSEGGKHSGPITINLNIERASEEEAERFAKKVLKIIENKGRMTRLGTR